MALPFLKDGPLPGPLAGPGPPFSKERGGGGSQAQTLIIKKK
jgi:hypothetical protein